MAFKIVDWWLRMQKLFNQNLYSSFWDKLGRIWLWIKFINDATVFFVTILVTHSRSLLFSKMVSLTFNGNWWSVSKQFRKIRKKNLTMMKMKHLTRLWIKHLADVHVWVIVQASFLNYYLDIELPLNEYLNTFGCHSTRNFTKTPLYESFYFELSKLPKRFWWTVGMNTHHHHQSYFQAFTSYKLFIWSLFSKISASWP